jgi:hypothetical protein
MIAGFIGGHDFPLDQKVVWGLIIGIGTILCLVRYVFHSPL